ncbi:PREDICTED: enolase 4-like [Amphimedon queenslandica]|uniref:Enolase 4 n=1 Tax=Amphimedon queenslandica TaxID=400682 RepID=A0A1X7VH21_AMPQE|nr:PREDICTED: enolase 4-like [Amphimedon queenslandica]|eukprot:XP_019848936.1 PREDICTED: enolase 4-like [Amphimedon queenslandica]
MQEQGGGRVTRELREKAVEYYSQHDATGALEKLLNKMYIDSPEDMYGYMSEYFHTLSNDPTVSSIEAIELLDSNGDPSLSLTLHCIVNGVSKAVGTYAHDLNWPKNDGELKWSGSKSKPPSGTNPKDTKETKDKSKESKEAKALPVKEEEAVVEEAKKEEVEEKTKEASTPPYLETVNRLNVILSELDLKSQIELNAVINQDHGITLHPSSKAAVSRVAALSLAFLSNQPLFLSLNQSFNKSTTSSKTFSLPLPLFNVVAGGLGKLRIRGVYLLPSPSSSLMTGFKNIMNVYKEMGHTLSTKGPAPVSKSGAYYFSCDKPEMLMDLIKEASASAGVTLKDEVLAYLDVGGESMYDEDKRKYELSTGQWKTGDELVNVCISLTSAYPWIGGFIDPLHPNDIASWQSLKEQLNEQCLLMAENALLGLASATIVIQKDTKGEEEEGETESIDSLSIINSGFISSSHTKTLSECFDEADDLKGRVSHISLSSLQPSSSFTSDSLSFDVDLAVALGCKLIKVGAPTGVTAAMSISRLIQVQGQLESLKLLGPSSLLMIPVES